MSLRDELMNVRDQYGSLTPRNTVEAARPADAPLHDRFEWDDATAGEAYRLEQAHELIMQVRVTYRIDAKRGPQTIREFHAIRGEEGYTYQTAGEIVADPFLTRLLLGDMEREWKSMRQRYDRFNEFWALVRTDLEKTA